MKRHSAPFWPCFWPLSVAACGKKVPTPSETVSAALTLSNPAT